jgi:GDP-4-dehydro-6-deoxy-D-mannose reductase
MKLFINAGGQGKRLQSVTEEIPKPMINIKGKPILHHLVDWAKQFPISEIIMMLGYKSEKIMGYFKDGSEFGIPIKYSVEPFPLGSGGPLKFARNHIDGTFVYINGDSSCEVDLNKMLDFHRKNNSDITVLLHKSSHPLDSDILKIDSNNRVTKFISKYENHEGAGDLSNAGLCVIEPKIIDLMEQEIFNFENYLYPKILQNGLKMTGYVTGEMIYDIGTRERLKTIIESDFRDKMNIFVTGAGGMMGSHILDFLVEKGHNVLGIDFVPTTDIRELNKQALYVECDIRDKEKLTFLLDKFRPGIIFHLAAQSFPTVSWEMPEYTIEANLLGTINLFEAVKKLKLDTIILNAGSSAEYGYLNREDIPVKENRELKPLHPYGITKVAQELLAYQYYKNFGIKSVTIRIFNTTGPKKINDVCSDFTKQIVLMEKGFQENVLRVGNINTQRAITDVRDMIEAFWLAVHKCDFGERYNVSGEKLYPIKEIIEILKGLTAINFEIQEDPRLIRPTDEEVIYGDSSKFKEKTGWSQKIDIITTLKDMLDYWRKKL